MFPTKCCIEKIPTIVRLSGFSVRLKGLEPPRLSAPDPKSGAATNYATAACCVIRVQRYYLFSYPQAPSGFFQCKYCIFLFQSFLLISNIPNFNYCLNVLSTLTSGLINTVSSNSKCDARIGLMSIPPRRVYMAAIINFSGLKISEKRL